MQYRQGDLLLVKLGARNQDDRERSSRSQSGIRLPHRIVAEREGTGHRHELSKGHLTRIPGSYLMASVPDGTVVSHPEHAPLTLPAGDYQVVRQREYTPAGPRGVWD